jgi:hypothetical protein
MKRLTRLYGSGPLHAALMLGCFAFAGYLLSRILHASHPLWILVWLLAAIVAHDLVLFPLYAAVDRLVTSRRSSRQKAPVVSWRNHVRVPVVISGTLLLITFPLVLRLSEPGYVRATGLHTSLYLGRWLLVTACLFAGSGVLYGIRRALAPARRRPHHRTG